MTKYTYTKRQTEVMTEIYNDLLNKQRNAYNSFKFYNTIPPMSEEWYAAYISYKQAAQAIWEEMN